MVDMFMALGGLKKTMGLKSGVWVATLFKHNTLYVTRVLFFVFLVPISTGCNLVVLISCELV